MVQETGEGLDVIRKEAWPFYRTISGVRLCWELEEPKGPKSVVGACWEKLKPKGPKDLEVIREEAWPCYRTSSGVRLCWELEEPKGPKEGPMLGV